MKNSEIKFVVQLDDKNIPEKIQWHATDGPSHDLLDARAVSISLWDPEQDNTMRIDLWNKDMDVVEMKRFAIESMDGVAEMIKSATGDDEMYKEITAMCKKLVKHVEVLHKDK